MGRNFNLIENLVITWITFYITALVFVFIENKKRKAYNSKAIKWTAPTTGYYNINGGPPQLLKDDKAYNINTVVNIPDYKEPNGKN